jgi:hypothetical protein
LCVDTINRQRSGGPEIRPFHNISPIALLFNTSIAPTTTMPTLTPLKQQNFRNDIIVSHSGRTLAEILSLSHSKELSLYTVDNVVPGFGKDGTVVRYSRPESEHDVSSSLLPSFHN